MCFNNTKCNKSCQWSNESQYLHYSGLNESNKSMLSRINIKLCMLLVPHQIYTIGASGTRLLMWATTGNHGYQWTYANVILSNPTPFRVTFQAEVGGDMWTNIALDDISYTPECMVGGKARVFVFCPHSFSRFLLFVCSFQPRCSFPRHVLQSSPSWFSSFFHIFTTNMHAPLPPLPYELHRASRESVVSQWSHLPCRSI